MSEEVGKTIKFAVMKQPDVLMRHERIEASPGNPKVRIFAVGYRADLLSGEVILSDSHTDMKWVSVHDFQPEKYFQGGWLKGVQEYLELRRS